MSEAFIAEIRIFAGNFAPRGWAFCDGTLLPIAQSTALFSLIGTIYGGDGQTTFGLPDLQGRAPMHPGNGPGLTTRQLGERGGTETVTLSEAQMAGHSHSMAAAGNQALVKTPSSTTALARTRFGTAYQTDTTNDLVDMAPEAMGSTGGSQAHNNLQPYLTLNFIIALEGTYPSQS